METVVERFGRLDVLVNNAGIMHFADIEAVTLDEWRKLFSINAEGTMLGCKHAIRAMTDSGGGSIINMSSTAAILGFPNLPAYSAPKGAIDSATKGYGVRCNSVQAASIDTPMVRDALAALTQLPEHERPNTTSPNGPFH